MKATGIVRKVDELGRIVIPKEIRDTRGIENGDPLEIYVDGSMIILKAYRPGCEMCGSMDGIVTHKGHTICESCLVDAFDKLQEKKDA